MTTKFVCILSILIFLFSCEDNREKDVPKEIRLSLLGAYPNASDVVWYLKEQGYEVDFSQENRAVELEFDIVGNIIEKEVIIPESDLPGNILLYIKDNYPQLHIREVSIEKDKGGTVYEVELLNGFFREIEVEFDTNGAFLNEESFNE